LTPSSCLLNFLLFQRLTATYMTNITAMTRGFANRPKYTRTITAAATKGRANMSFCLGVNTFSPGMHLR
jgi:hypothetical protein